MIGNSIGIFVYKKSFFIKNKICHLTLKWVKRDNKQLRLITIQMPILFEIIIDFLLLFMVAALADQPWNKNTQKINTLIFKSMIQA